MMITIWWYDDQPTNRRTSEDRATQPMQWKLEAEFRNIKHLSIFLNKTKSLRQGLKITIEIFHQDTFSIIKFQPCHLWNKVLCWKESLQDISNVRRNHKWIKREQKNSFIHCNCWTETNRAKDTMDIIQNFNCEALFFLLATQPYSSDPASARLVLVAHHNITRSCWSYYEISRFVNFISLNTCMQRLHYENRCLGPKQAKLQFCYTKVVEIPRDTGTVF